MANFGQIPNNISLGASQSIRRNAGDTAFEAINQTDRANHTGTQDISTITGLDYTKVAYPTTYKIGDPTHIDTLQEIFNHEFSSGVMHGANLTNNGDGTITLSSGVGMLRSSADAHTPLYSIEFAQQTLTLTDNATNYISLSYNSGTPTFIVSTSETSFNCLDICIAYVVTRRGTSIKWADAREQNVDGNRKSRRLFLDFSRFIHTAGGTILGGSGLNVNVTAGSFYFMLQQITHPAFDTSVAGTANENVFTLAYRNGTGGHTLVANTKAVDSTLYDSGTGTLATLGNNKFGVTWFYILNDNPSQLWGVVGQAEYPDLATARVATPPTDIPFELQGLGALIGFVIYEKSATSFNQELSAFSTTFGASQATSHNSLAGLQGGITGEYNHITNAQLAILNNTSGTNSGDQTDATLTFTDITTNNASATKHGFLPKLDNTGTKYLRDDGTWQTVSGGSNPIFETQIAGELTVGKIARFTVKGTQTIAGVKISLGTLPTGADFKVQVYKNGIASTDSIFTSDATIDITTAQGATNGIYITTKTTIDNGSLVENDVLYFYITQVGSTLSGTNLEIVAY